jgi:hypothetical protein
MEGVDLLVVRISVAISGLPSLHDVLDITVINTNYPPNNLAQS